MLLFQTEAKMRKLRITASGWGRKKIKEDTNSL
jgi:hypothetical protein